MIDSISRRTRSPRGVRSYAPLERTRRGSPKVSRSLFKARLIAGWLKKERLAARLTCRSSSRGWIVRSRFRSTFLKCASCMGNIPIMHWLNMGQRRTVVHKRRDMTRTYRAVQVTEPGKLNLVELPIREPAPAQVRIRVEACGVCHSDVATVEGPFPGLTFPRVPGHEVVGRIDAVGSDVSNWEIGQRVGVGFFGGQDGKCEPCQRGDFVNCTHPVVTGITADGGYAEVMIAEARALSAVPDELTSAEAAPLLCAGVTTYNALRNAGLRGGDLVAVQGIGGLGHLGVQFARQMGFRTVAIGRGREKEKLAKDLGAHVYIDTAVDDAAAVLQRMGGARAILATAPSGNVMGPLVSGLAVRGKLIIVGVPEDQIQLSAWPLVFGGRSIYGSLTGTPIDSEDTLAFSVLENIRPMIETAPLEQAADAYARMMQGKARFRMVLVTKDGVAQRSPVN